MTTIENTEIKPELITVTNDAKEKRQSWEAAISFQDSFYNGVGELDLIGYGDCEEEARANLNLMFQKLIQVVVDH